jgi:transmembrane sensor
MPAKSPGNYLQELAFRVLQNEASETEMQFLNAYYEAFDQVEDIQLSPGKEAEISAEILKAINTQIALDSVGRPASVQRKWKISRIYKFSVAAMLFMTLGAGLYYIILKPKADVAYASVYANDIPAGGNKALLTLANGKQVQLDHASLGKIAQETGVRIVKSADGQIEYHTEGNVPAGQQLVNTFSTPLGGQYKLVLPDGSRVWLNSLSTLKFPLSFHQGPRQVELSGEAYFEIAPAINKHTGQKQAFVVNSQGQQVEVLGTHFNVNAYPQEQRMITTLLEGSVRVVHQRKSYLLKPNQEALVEAGQVSLKPVNTELAVAWVNGDFIFRDESIQLIMSKLSRWYDIQVVYEGALSKASFGAEISRKKSLSQVLKALEKTGDVHFKIEGRRVTVMP